MTSIKPKILWIGQNELHNIQTLKSMHNGYNIILVLNGSRLSILTFYS